MQDLARYRGSDYDWSECEAKLNALPNFRTEIDGLARPPCRRPCARKVDRRSHAGPCAQK
jgi:hypothetical protein